MTLDSDSRIDEIMDRMAPADESILRSMAGNPEPGTLHGLNEIENPDVIWWASNYADMAAMIEAGYTQTVMLAPAPRQDVFAPLRDHEEKLSAAGLFILAGGTPEFVGELARRLGRHRVWIVNWPKSCDGAADALAEGGPDAVEAAEPFPIAGIYRPSGEAMVVYLHRPFPEVMSTGCEATDSIFSLPTEGKLIIVTGIPSHGKSTYVRHLMAHTADKHNRRWAVFSPEMGEWQDSCAKLIGWLADKPFRGMAEHDIKWWAEWCRSRFAFISRDSEDEAPTLDWLIETYRACVLRDGLPARPLESSRAPTRRHVRNGLHRFSPAPMECVRAAAWLQHLGDRPPHKTPWGETGRPMAGPKRIRYLGQLCLV